MKRSALSFVLLMKRASAVAVAAIFLTGCGIEIVDVTAPTSVASGKSFEIEVTQQFSESSEPEEEAVALVFVFIVPEAWSPRAGGSYDGEWDGVPVSLNVEVLDTIESDWNDLLYDPDEGSPCLEEYADDEDAQEACAFFKSLDAIEFVPFFYGGAYPPPAEPDYQLLYVRTEQLPSGAFLEGDTGVLTLPFSAGALQRAGDTQFVVQLAAELTQPVAEAVRERLPADQQKWWPARAAAANAGEGGDTLSYVLWIPSENEGLTVELDGYDVPVGNVVFASVMQFIADSLPVPLGGPALYALIALGLVGLGIVARRKQRR